MSESAYRAMTRTVTVTVIVIGRRQFALVDEMISGDARFRVVLEPKE